MVGDWNVVQNCEKDTTNYMTKNNPKAQKTIIEMKENLDLVDIYRAKKPKK